MRLLLPFLAFAASIFPGAGICLAQQTNPSKARVTLESDHGPGKPLSSDALRQFNSSLIALAKKVSPAVVQIMVTGYAPARATARNNNSAVIAREHALGSGVILGSDGYIVTNAHVVEGAQRIQVALAERDGTSPFDISPVGRRKVLKARVVGSDKETDLALLKVDAHNLNVLPLGATRPVYPGEVVLAVGSPEGLQSSITMGVVSSTWRQLDSDQPMAYIQTDAPINPGNSGGALVDLDGYVVGLNTLILTEGGGSEGLGFAIPAGIVQFVYEDLRRYGHVHRLQIQAKAQEITPTMAEGLGLSQDWGVLISDVVPDGPAGKAGLRVQDIVYAVDGRQIAGLPGFTAALYLHSPDTPLKLDVLRGPQKVSLLVAALQQYDVEDDLVNLVDGHSLLDRLGVYVVNLNDKLRAALPDLRFPSGVIVVAQSSEQNSATSGLRAGDIIHTLNQTPIDSVKQLRAMLRDLRPGQAVVLQIERAGKLQYGAFEWGD
jgi:serine protease Do